MLGEQIAELKGKIMAQRVLDAQGPTMEASISASGSVKGTQVINALKSTNVFEQVMGRKPITFSQFARDYAQAFK